MVTFFMYGCLVVTAFGAVLGAWLGSWHFGIVGGAVGMLLGPLAGIAWYFVWHYAVVWWFHRKFFSKSTEELEAWLKSEDCSYPRNVIVALGYRGYDIQQYVPHVLQMLTSDNLDIRRRWYDTIWDLLDLPDEIYAYRPDDSLEICREKIAKVREQMSRPSSS